MNHAAPFLTTITYVRGRLVLVSRDGEGFRLSPHMLKSMLDSLNVLSSWTEPETIETEVGPFWCISTRVCDIELPLELADKTVVRVPVSADWLLRMRPAFVRTLEILNESPQEQVSDFTLELSPDGAISLLPPDRRTLRPV